MGSSTLADTLPAMADPAEELADAIASALSDASDNADEEMNAKTHNKYKKPKKDNKESKTNKEDRKEKDRAVKTNAKRLEKQRAHDERQITKRKRATDLAAANEDTVRKALKFESDVLRDLATELALPGFTPAAGTCGAIPVLAAADTTPPVPAAPTEAADAL
eukprot:7793341-Heterocapsa_arctica.AAC.1